MINMTDEIKELENKIFRQIENPLGKTLSEIGKNFDIVKDFSEKDFKDNKEEIEKELDKWVQDSIKECEEWAGVKEMYKKYPDKVEEIIREYHIDTLENPDKMKYPLGYTIMYQLDREGRINHFIQEYIKTNKKFNEAYKRHPTAIRELFRRLFIYPKRDRREIIKELLAEFGIDGNEIICIDENFNHRDCTGEYCGDLI